MTKGVLRVYLGAAPGVGKTYAMLQAARERLRDGVDVHFLHRRAPVAEAPPRHDG